MKIILLIPGLCVLLCGHSLGQLSNIKRQYPFEVATLEHLANNLGQNDTIAPVFSDGGFVYMNTYTMKPAIQQKFEVAYPFYENFGLVKVEGKYGVINRKGTFIVKPSFPGFELRYDDDFGIMFDQGHYFWFSNGEMLPKKPIPGCGEPLIPQFTYFRKGTKFGLSYRGDTIKKAVFDSVIAIGYKVAVVEKAGKIGAIDYEGKTVLGFHYRKYAGVPGDALGAFALEENGIWYYYRDSTLLFKSKLESAFTGGLLLVKIRTV